MTSPCRRVTRSLIVGMSICAAGGVACGRAEAFDFFGLFGSDETPPAVSQDALPYTVAFEAADADKALTNFLKDASSLYRLRQDPPPDGETLARPAQNDFAPPVSTLWGPG